MSKLQCTDVSICILNRNQKELLRQCVVSCYGELERSRLAGEIIVIDNASADGSPEMAAKLFPKVRVICNQENAGFSVANNCAIRVSTGRFVFILNNDTILHNGCLKELVGYMDAHPEVGLAGPKLLNPDGSVQLGYNRTLPNVSDTLATLFGLHHIWLNNPIRRRAWQIPEMNDEGRVEPRPIGQIGGCAMMLRRKTLDAVGFFDEDFHLWYEDVELSERIAKNGWKLMYVPRARVTHLGGATFSNLGAGEKVEWQAKSLVVFFKKSRRPFEYYLVKTATFLTLAFRLPIAILLALSPRYETRRRWKSAPSAHWKAMLTVLHA